MGADIVKVGTEKESIRREGRRLRSRLKGGAGSGGGGAGGGGGGDGNGGSTQILDFVNQKVEEQDLRQQKLTLAKKAELAHVAWLKARSLATKDAAIGGMLKV